MDNSTQNSASASLEQYISDFMSFRAKAEQVLSNKYLPSFDDMSNFHQNTFIVQYLRDAHNLCEHKCHGRLSQKPFCHIALPQTDQLLPESIIAETIDEWYLFVKALQRLAKGYSPSPSDDIIVVQAKAWMDLVSTYLEVEKMIRSFEDFCDSEMQKANIIKPEHLRVLELMEELTERYEDLIDEDYERESHSDLQQDYIQRYEALYKSFHNTAACHLLPSNDSTQLAKQYHQELLEELHINLDNKSRIRLTRYLDLFRLSLFTQTSPEDLLD